MVNVGLVEIILREQDNPGCSTTRQIRDIYNNRSGEDPIIQNSDQDKEFQSILLKSIQTLPMADDDNDDDDDDDEDKPISYTVKLKDSDESSTPTIKRRSIIKLPKEIKEQSESDETSSDSEKPSTTSSITITKPFSPLFLNNMKKFGVTTDWLAKRSNLLRQSTYSRSSVESNTSQLDAMIKRASAKPIRSNRKLSFVETTTPTKTEIDKENTDPLTEINDTKEESNEITKTSQEPTPYDLNSDIDENKENENENEKDDDSSPTSKVFSLRIPRVNLSDEKNKRSSSISSDDETKQEKIKPKKKRKSKKETTATTNTKKNSSPKQDKDEQTTTTTNDDTKNLSQKTSKNEKGQSRIEHLKKLLRISGIRFIIKNTELDELRSNKARINYLKSLFDKAGFTGSLAIKECEKFRKKRDAEKELLEIQANSVNVKGHIKGGRTLRGEGRNTNEFDMNNKRKRTASSEIEDNEQKSNNNSSDNERIIIKKRRIMKMEASPEVSENE
ncbi:unnamed protein product [Rotaria sordida]|uniref:Uncharacterized protein n=1 Tax=Rotaria sordida TaxID=392033 RepID=A0A813PH07_9BILA|nr:unnamed protein product [Rotaria sordida]CAF0809579.1 unnamed protein product [Rotaria sordida]